MRCRALVLASVLALAGCGGNDTNEAVPETGSTEVATDAVTTEQLTTEAERTPPNPARNKALEAHLRQYLPLGMGSYYQQVASVVVTNTVTITTKTSDPTFLYRGACGTALDLAREYSGVTDVEVLDASGTVKSSSVGTGQCDKRY